jgi:hypothetical protein
MHENCFYTYAYLREDKTPYYIGKGKGQRAFVKLKNEIPKPKYKDRIIILKNNLTEEEAFKHEIYLIYVLGRKDLGTGILRNRTDGGDGPSGVKRTKEVREKISNALKGRKCPGVSLANRLRPKEEHSCFGKPRSEETKRKLSLKLTGRKATKERAERISKANKGKVRTEEHRRKYSEAKRGVKQNDIHRKNNAVSKCKYIYYLMCPTGETVKTINLTQFSRDNNFPPGSTYRLSTGEYQEYRGWKLSCKVVLTDEEHKKYFAPKSDSIKQDYK